MHILVWDHFGDRPRNGVKEQVGFIDKIDKTPNIENLYLTNPSIKVIEYYDRVGRIPLEILHKNKLVVSENWRNKNRDRYNLKRREHYQKNLETKRECCKIKARKRWAKYSPEQKQKIAQKSKEWVEKNRDRRREQTKIYKLRRLGKYELSKNCYSEITKAHFKLRNNLSRAIHKKLKARSMNKNRNSITNFLPYTISDLMKHLESQFTRGMTWDNYGKWHIDHIIPDTSFNYKSVYDDKFQRCWSLSNLQPLWAIDNIKKGNKVA